MDIKDLDSKVTDAVSRPVTESQKNLSQLRAASVASVSVEAATIEVRQNAITPKTGEIRQKINSALTQAHVATHVTEQVDNLFDSIVGVSEQASDPTTPPDRISYLEREGNQLLNEVKRIFRDFTSDKQANLNTDEVRSEVEEKLSRALDALFPENSESPFGVSHVDFSTKDTIINTVTQVQKAKKQIEELSSSVQEAAKNIELSANFTEVALQNTEASKSSVRDLDSALKLAYSTKLAIDANPDRAIASVGELGEKAFKLLRNS